MNELKKEHLINMSQDMQLLERTNTLSKYVEQIESKFLMVKESGEKGDFFNEVKPFADEVQQVNNEWKEEAKAWININKPRNLNGNQIDSASEQIDMISVQSFYPETSRTRFINYVQSVRYVLTLLQTYLDKYERKK